MPLLTLARFVLEYTLMDYNIVTLSDSKMAAAALYLAFKMKKEQEWDDTLIHFSGSTMTCLSLYSYWVSVVVRLNTVWQINGAFIL